MRSSRSTAQFRLHWAYLLQLCHHKFGHCRPGLLSSWRPGTPPAITLPSEWFSRFAHAVERSLQGFVEEVPGQHLPTKCFGRGKRLKPESQTQAVPPKPSRPGEVTLRHDLLGAEVLRWFRQLRRLQSMVHSLRSNNDTATAQVYWLDLWRAILRGKGFRGGFMEWWRTPRVRLAGSPSAVPLALPGLVMAEAIYFDFRANFRDFESWHLRQRTLQLQAKYDKTQKQLYLELRSDAPPQVDTLTLHHVHEVVTTEPSQQLWPLSLMIAGRLSGLWRALLLLSLKSTAESARFNRTFFQRRDKSWSKFKLSIPLLTSSMNSYVYGPPGG